MILACVYKTGGDFTLEYVQRLTDGLRQHSEGCRIVCLSDDPMVGKYAFHIPLITDFTGWWAKLELFRFVNEPVFYVDLDTVINGDLTPILNYPHKFTMLDDFLSPERPASGVMAFNGDYRYLMEGFNMDMADQYRTSKKWGDQGYLSEHITPDRFQSLFPVMVVSRKVHSKDDREKASIVCYHGNPRPHTTGWAV